MERELIISPEVEAKRKRGREKLLLDECLRKRKGKWIYSKNEFT